MMRIGTGTNIIASTIGPVPKLGGEVMGMIIAEGLMIKDGRGDKIGEETRGMTIAKGMVIIDGGEHGIGTRIMIAQSILTTV